MSSILKALKKIEGRKVDKSLPAWPYGTGSLESMDRHIRRSRQRQKILGLLIILCGIALAGKFYLGSRPVADNTASQSAPATEAALPEKPVQVTQPDAQKSVAETPRSAQPPPRETSPETIPPSATSPSPEEEASPETALPLIISPLPVESEGTAATDESPATAVEPPPQRPSRKPLQRPRPTMPASPSWPWSGPCGRNPGLW